MTTPNKQPAEMRGEDVPQNVVDAARRGYSMHGAGLVANLIAAGWPEIERVVREQVAREIEANPMNECSGAVAACARIARGGSR